MATTTTARLRDLGDAEFESRYDTDRFTASVLGSRYRYIVKHMCTHLMTNAFSVIIRDWYDFAATVSGPPSLGYPMCAVSDSLTLFTGVMAAATRNTVEEFGAENLRPGDILICNDPYRTGTHPNDILFVRPAFRDGELIGMLNIQAHMIDVGGIIPFGFSPTKRNIYENGLVIPPMLMFRDDRPVRSTFDLIFGNARFGEIMLPDFLSIASDLRLGERLLGEAVDRYGLPAYLGALRYVTDVSAEAMSDSLLRMPDGVYEGEDMIDCDGLDDSEEYLVRVKVKIAGRRVEVDLSGSSRQARTCINCGGLDSMTAIAVALKFLLEPATPFTSGVFRHIDLVVPPGSVACAMPPDGAIMLNFEISNALLNATFRALAPALGADAIAGDLGSGMAHSANGLRADGSAWGTIGTAGGENGPWGATRHGDAEGSLTLYMSNCIAPTVEAVEADTPVVLMRKEYATDTAGAGANRGGAAIRKDSLWLTEGDHYPNVIHVKRPSGTGVAGGHDGPTGGVWLWEPTDTPGFRDVDAESHADAVPVAGVFDPQTNMLDPEGTYMHVGRRPVWRVQPGAMFRYQTNAGGGWGDPREREPERVLRDVRDEYISIEFARDMYGVVVLGDPEHDPEGLTIDAAATAKLRGS